MSGLLLLSSFCENPEMMNLKYAFSSKLVYIYIYNFLSFFVEFS